MLEFSLFSENRPQSNILSLIQNYEVNEKIGKGVMK